MSAPTECGRETKVYYQNCARGTPTDDLVRPDAHTTPVSDVTWCDPMPTRRRCPT